jgi:hypothetical protein
MKTKAWGAIVMVAFMWAVVGGCSSGGDVRVELPQGKHLQDTLAGAILFRDLKIDYHSKLPFMYKIRESLEKHAVLEDRYRVGKKGLVVKRWRIGSLDNPFAFVMYEKIPSNNEFWFERPLGDGALLYQALIGSKAKELKPNREHESAIYISSKTDRARLILFGYGKYCTSMSILGGT